MYTHEEDIGASRETMHGEVTALGTDTYFTPPARRMFKPTTRRDWLVAGVGFAAAIVYSVAAAFMIASGLVNTDAFLLRAESKHILTYTRIAVGLWLGAGVMWMSTMLNAFFCCYLRNKMWPVAICGASAYCLAMISFWLNFCSVGLAASDAAHTPPPSDMLVATVWLSLAHLVLIAIASATIRGGAAVDQVSSETKVGIPVV